MFFLHQLRVVNFFYLKVDKISDILVLIKLSLLWVEGSTCFSHKVTGIISLDEDRKWHQIVGKEVVV